MKGKRYLAKNIIFLTVGQFGTKFLTFFLVPLYTRVLTSSEYGTFDLYSATVSLLVPVLTLNIADSTTIFLLDKNNKIRMIDKELSLEKDKQFGKYVSLIPFGGNVEGLTLKGMKYPLDNYNLGGFNSLGISNEIVDDTALITFEKGVLLVIESRD